MMETRTKATEKLTQLLRKNYEAEKGYRKAADNTDSQLLRKVLLSEAETRKNFTAQIEDEIVKLGGVPEKKEEPQAKIHRAWMDVKRALSGNTDQAIVEECQNGDRAAIKEYEEVLKQSDLTASSRKLVQQQREEITDMYNQLKNLKI